MSRSDAQPWFQAAVQLLDVRRQDRVLTLQAEAPQVRALAALVGGRGEVTAVHSDRSKAEAIAALELAHVEVLAHATTGGEQFGSFDALLLAPRWAPEWPPGAYADLAQRNLRPGGRLVFDLPAPDMLPDVTAAGAALGWPRAGWSPLCGLADDRLAEILRNAGLRRVQALLGSHLLHLESPFELVDAFAGPVAATAAQRSELGEALVRRLGTTAAVDVLVHRTRVQALR